MSLEDGVVDWVDAAASKPLMFLDDRFDRFHVILLDRLCIEQMKSIDNYCFVVFKIVRYKIAEFIARNALAISQTSYKRTAYS